MEELAGEERADAVRSQSESVRGDIISLCDSDLCCLQAVYLEISRPNRASSVLVQRIRCCRRLSEPKSEVRPKREARDNQ